MARVHGEIGGHERFEMNDPDNGPELPMNTYWVVPGRFAAGEYPGALHRREAAYKLRILLEAGISRFIDLTEPYEGLEPYAEIAAKEASRLGRSVQHSRHSIVDLQVPQSPHETTVILDVIDEAIGGARRCMCIAGAALAEPARWLAAGSCVMEWRATKRWLRLRNGGRAWRRRTARRARPRCHANVSTCAIGGNRRRRSPGERDHHAGSLSGVFAGARGG